MSDHQVAHSVVEMLVSIADAGGLSLAELCEGLPIDERTLRRRLGGLEWALFVELLEREEARLGHERLMELSAAVRDISPIGRRLLGRFVSPRLLLSFVFRVLGPSMYPMYAVTSEESERDDGALVVHIGLHLKDGLRGCRAIFDAHAVATAAMPTFIGQPPFPVRAETTDRGGDYWFEVRPPRPR